MNLLTCEGCGHAPPRESMRTNVAGIEFLCAYCGRSNVLVLDPTKIREQADALRAAQRAVEYYEREVKEAEEALPTKDLLTETDALAVQARISSLRKELGHAEGRFGVMFGVLTVVYFVGGIWYGFAQDGFFGVLGGLVRWGVLGLLVLSVSAPVLLSVTEPPAKRLKGVLENAEMRLQRHEDARKQALRLGDLQQRLDDARAGLGNLNAGVVANQ